MRDFEGMSDREILITVAERQTFFKETFATYTEACERKNEDHEDRIRALEDRPAGNPNVAESVKDHEKRIRGLERWQWKATGIVAGIGAISGSIAGLIFGRGS